MQGAILILTQCFPPATGGIENLMAGLARALSESGERVVVYADGPPAGLPAAGKYEIKRFGGFKPLRRMRKRTAAEKLLNRGAIKKVFCDSWKSAELPEFGDVPLFVFAHGSEYPLVPGAVKQKRIARTLQKADKILAVSQATKARVAACGAGAANIAVVHPPIAPPPTATPPGGRDARRLWGNGAPRVLTVARLTPRKGADKVIESVAKLSPRYPRLRYVIVGEGKQETVLRKMADELKMSEKICFAGRASDDVKSALMVGADVFALPARADKDDVEGYGIAFLEAGWFGLPSLAGASGGAGEAVEDGVTGLLCDGGDSDSVSSALDTLLRDEPLRRRLGEAARARAKKQTWEARLGDFV